MKKLNKKIGSLALAGMMALGGVAAVGVQAYAVSGLLQREYEKEYDNEDINVINRELSNLGGNYIVFEAYSSKGKVEDLLRSAPTSQTTSYIPRVPNERLNRYLERFLNRGYDVFGIEFNGLIYVIVSGDYEQAFKDYAQGFGE